MRNWQRKTAAAALLAAVIAFGTMAALQLSPSRQVAKKQEALLSGIERRNAARVDRLLADKYRDRWGFTAADVVEAVVDVGGQFLLLTLAAEDPRIEIEGDLAVVTARLRVGGTPAGPLGGEITRRANRLDEPFRFIWVKQSLLPASWRLVEIDNPALPERLYGYRPGDLRRAMEEL